MVAVGYELLLVAGGRGADAPHVRRAAIRHAAALVPGVVSTEEVLTPEVAGVVVQTAPCGGTVAAVERERDGTRMTIAMTRRGVAAAGRGVTAGSEAAHATILLRADGAVDLSVDGVALIPVYWGQHDGQLIASTHLASLVSLGLPADIDETAVAEYLVMHHPLGARTLLGRATVVPPGGALTWQDGDIAHQGSRPALSTPAGVEVADAELVESFGDLWQSALTDAFDGAGRVGVSLSGGLDSRAIAEGATTIDERPLTMTYGGSGSDEMVVAAEVAEALGLPHLAMPVTGRAMLRHSTETLKLLDGCHGPNEMYDAWFSEQLRDVVDTVLNGHCGDPLWGHNKAVGLTTRRAVLDNHWRRYGPEARQAQRFLAADLRLDLTDVARASLERSLEPWEFEARPDTAIFWNIANRQFRWGHSVVTVLRRLGLRVEVPFLDGRVLDVLGKLSPRQHMNGSLYLRAYRDLFPRTGGIPRADDGNSPRSLNHLYWSADRGHARQLAELTVRHPLSGTRRAVRQARHQAAVILRRQANRSGPADRSDRRRMVFPIDVWLRSEPEYAERLGGLLRAAVHPWISEEAVEGAITAIRAGRPEVSAAVLGRVAALGGWLNDYDRRADASGRARA